MTTTFRRRVGPVADVKELEYVSALHQTCMPNVREDGTVSSKDVITFLQSRVGLIVPPQHGKRIVRGLGGGSVDDSVIQQILSEANEDPLKIEKRKDHRNIMEKLRLAQSLGALRKRLLRNKSMNNESEDDSDAISANLKEDVVEAAQEIDRADEDSANPAKQSSRKNASTAQNVPNLFDDGSPDVENPMSSMEDNEEYLDLMQIMAILLIPTLARAGQEWNNPPPPPPSQPQEMTPHSEYKGFKGFIQKIYDEYNIKQQERQVAFDESLRPHPENILSNVFETLLKSAHARIDSPPVLNATLVRKLLILNGECERAADVVLVDKMVEAASTDTGCLDMEAFVQALTADLSEWDVGSEDRNTTSFYDVYGFSNYYEKAIQEIEAEEEKEVVERGDIKDPSSGLLSEAETVLQGDVNDLHLESSQTIGLIKSAVANEKDRGTVYAALSLVEEAGAEGVNMAVGAGTKGVNLAKQAGAVGVNVVKDAETGGTKGLKAEKRVLADNGVVKFMDKLLSPPYKSMHILEKNTDQSAQGDESDASLVSVKSMDRIETEFTARKTERKENRASHSSKGLRRRSKESSTSTPSAGGDEVAPYKLKKIRSIFAVDSATDVYSSSLLMVGIFIFFICTSLTYAVLFQQMNFFHPDCGDKFGCVLVDKIIVWVIFAFFLSFCGYFVILPLSTGNNPMERSPLLNFVAVIIALVLTWIPYAAVEAYKKRVDEPYEDQTEKTVTEPLYAGAEWVTRVIGCIVAGLIGVQFLLSIVGNRRIRQDKFRVSKLFLTSASYGTGRMKRAATRKINRLLQNANDMKPKNLSNDRKKDLDVSEEVMINYVIRGERFEDCGGIYWTWNQLITGALYEEEGVWLMSRLRIIQTIQALFIGFKTYALTLFIEHAIGLCEEWQANLQPDLPQWVYDFVPTPTQARLALWPAFSVAVLIMLTIFFIYLPSYVRRVVQYRCGMIPSLHSDYFYNYRKSVDLVYTNVGNALYAMFGAALLFFFLVGLIIMLFVWPFSQEFMLTLTAWGLGLGITISIKYVIESFQRAYYYAGLYRTRPRRANFSQLGLECWYIGLGGGVLISRFCQFILAACFFVGRTDVPFLSGDVVLFGYIFDYAPQSFVKDILVHEAHRHPYIERLCVLYMMKLKNNKFCSEAGACWRLLFVSTLMPWMVQHRVFSDERLGECREEYNTRRREGQSPLQLKQHEEMKAMRDGQLSAVRSMSSSKPGVEVGRASTDIGIEQTLSSDLFLSNKDALPLN